MAATGRTLLLIDDEKMITEPLKIGLERRGFLVTTYNDPEKAVAEYQPGTYSVVITDMRMPGVSGLEVCRRLLRKDRMVRLCLFSGFDFLGDEAEKEMSDLPVMAFIKKPISIAQLATIIDGLIARTSL